MRSREAVGTLQKICGPRPGIRTPWLTLAAWQAWFDQDHDYETTRQKMMQLADGTDEAPVEQATAKTFCLRPSTNTVLLAKALQLARLGVDSKHGTPSLPWYQLTLGLAEYRSGDCTNAEHILALAAQNAGKYAEIPWTAQLVRAMCLFQLGRADEARLLFNQAGAQMPAFPSDPRLPVLDGKAVSHDVVIGWLAYREAKSLINSAAP